MIEERNLDRLKAAFLLTGDVEDEIALSTLIETTSYFVTNHDIFEGLCAALRTAHSIDSEITLATWFDLLDKYTMPNQNEVVEEEWDGRDIQEGNRG